MNQFFNNLQKEARIERLTPQEKQRMRVQLYQAMQNPAPIFDAPKTAKKVASPYYSFSFSAIRLRFAVPVAAILIVMLGSGTAFAAQGALPGDPLYAVKININEQIQQTLATTPRAKVQVNANLAAARLEEAETLAAAGKLTATTSAELAQNFDKHVEASQASTQTLAQTDPDAAAQLSAQVDSSLSAHGAILAQLGDDSNNAQTKQDSNTLVLHVRLYSHDNNQNNNENDNTENESAGTSTNLESASSTMVMAYAVAPKSFALSAAKTATAPATTSEGSNTPPAQKKQSSTRGSVTNAMHLEAEASSTLNDAQLDFAAIQSSLDAATIAQVQIQFALADSAMAQGSTSLAAGNYSDAIKSFTGVLRMATRLDTYLQAGKKFNKHLLSSLLTAMSQVQQKNTNSGKNSDSKKDNTDNSGKGSGDENNSENHNDDTQASSSSNENSTSSNSGSGHSTSASSSLNLPLQVHL